MAQGESVEYDESSLFTFEIEGEPDLLFESCSEFEEEMGEVEQRNGGSKDVAAKFDGIRSLTPLTLVRGASDDMRLADWWERIKASGSRANEKNGSLVQHNPDGSVKSRINIQRSFLGRYKRGPWSAEEDSIVKEEVELRYHGAKIVVGG